MAKETTVIYVTHGKKTLKITGTHQNEPSPEALAQAAAKLALIRVRYREKSLNSNCSS